ncbi:MAG: T9SS type A sorting domain-containing protein [Flavobacteriales bacterium]
MQLIQDIAARALQRIEAGTGPGRACHVGGVHHQFARERWTQGCGEVHYYFTGSCDQCGILQQQGHPQGRSSYSVQPVRRHDPQPNGTVSVEVLDASGRCVLRAVRGISSGLVNLDASSLAPGAYAVRYTDGARPISQRLIIE